VYAILLQLYVQLCWLMLERQGDLYGWWEVVGDCAWVSWVQELSCCCVWKLLPGSRVCYEMEGALLQCCDSWDS
jgi:hypothetical protein